MKKFLYLIIACLLSISLLSCSPVENNKTAENNTENNSEKENEENNKENKTEDDKEKEDSNVKEEDNKKTDELNIQKYKEAIIAGDETFSEKKKDSYTVVSLKVVAEKKIDGEDYVFLKYIMQSYKKNGKIFEEEGGVGSIAKVKYIENEDKSREVLSIEYPLEGNEYLSSIKNFAGGDKELENTLLKYNKEGYDEEFFNDQMKELAQTLEKEGIKDYKAEEKDIPGFSEGKMMKISAPNKDVYKGNEVFVNKEAYDKEKADTSTNWRHVEGYNLNLDTSILTKYIFDGF